VRRTPPGVASRSRPSTCRRTDRSAQVASLIMRSERGVSSLGPRTGSRFRCITPRMAGRVICSHIP
jgi:hypothetical protein